MYSGHLVCSVVLGGNYLVYSVHVVFGGGNVGVVIVSVIIILYWIVSFYNCDDQNTW